MDPKSGRTYYANTVTRKTQWDVPEDWIEDDLPRVYPEENTKDEELPPNWEVMHDPSSGKPFYVNHELKITQWTRPSGKTQTRERSNGSAKETTSSAAMARILQASLPNSFSQPRSFFHEASYFQPSQLGTTGEMDLSDTMPNLDFTVKKVADKHRLECPQCQALFTLSKRRHHCRLCGDVFCDSCSSHRVTLPLEGPEFEKPVRICDLCNRDVEQGNFFSMRRYLTPLTLYDPENADDDDDGGVATARNVNAALAALTFDLDQIVHNAEGFQDKVTIPPDVLVSNIIKHLSSRSETSERAIRALASLLSLGSMVGKSDFATAVYQHGSRRTLDQIMGILERSGSDRRTLFVQEKAAQVMFYLTEGHIISALTRKSRALTPSAGRGDNNIEVRDVESFDMQRCLRNMIDHSSLAKNPNLQRWATATVRNLVVEDQRRTCLAINEVAERVASGEPVASPDYESFLSALVSSGGIMILCSLIGAEDSDTRAHATSALGTILTATRAIDSAMSALSEMTGGAAGYSQRNDGDIIRAISAGSGFGPAVSQLLLSAEHSVAGMGCQFVASLVLPILSDGKGSANLPSKYDCRNDNDSIGASREAALEIAGGGCLPALLSLVKENGRLTRPIELRCSAMEVFAATALAVGGIGRAWAGGRYEEQMEMNGAPALLTRAVSAFNDEQVIDVALQVLKSSSVQSLGSQQDSPAIRIREAAGIVLGAISSCSAEAIMELDSRQVMSNLILTANDTTMTLPSNLRGDKAPRCLGMLEAAASVLFFAWQHTTGSSSELLDRLIEVLDVGAVSLLFRALTFKMDWDSRENAIGGMKARSAACRFVYCLFGIARSDNTHIGMRRLMESCDSDQASRRVIKGPRNIMEAVLTALQSSLTSAQKQLTGGGNLGADYNAAVLELLEASLLATGGMCGSLVAPGGNEGSMIRGDQLLDVQADGFEPRRREVCKVACDVIIRSTQVGSAILPTMLIGGFGEGAVDASLRLSLAIAQNGSKDQHSKLASSGIIVPISDLLKSALSTGDLYRFSASLALVRFCGPYVASGASGGIQSVRDAIRIATNVLTLPIDLSARSEEIRLQESLKAECVRAIESLSKNSSLWSAISKDALPSMVSYLNNSLGQARASPSLSDAGAGALRAVLEIVQVPSHATFAAECGLADSLGNILKNGSDELELCDLETRSLAIHTLHILVSRQDSRRYCNLLRSGTLRSVCAAIGRSASMMQDPDIPKSSALICMGLEIVHLAINDIESLGDTADILHSKEALFFVDSVGGDRNFVRALCSSFLKQHTGMFITKKRTDVDDEKLTIPSTYGKCLEDYAGPCAGFQLFYDAVASLLFTISAYASAIDSDKSESFWNIFLAKDLNNVRNEADCRRAALSLISLFLYRISRNFFMPTDELKQTEYETLLFPLVRYRFLEAIKDILQEELKMAQHKAIDDDMMAILVYFEIPRICLDAWKDPAIIDLSCEILTILLDEEPEEILLALSDSKDSILTLFDLLKMDLGPQSIVQSTDVHRFLSSTLEALATSGALAKAVEKFDIRSRAIDALACACLNENTEPNDDDEEDLTSNKRSTGYMKCLVDLCTREMDDGQTELNVEPSDAACIAEKLGKKLCEMVISRFLERARMHRYEIHDHENIMGAPDIAMLCAISQHESTLHILRSIGGFHALAQIAAEGELAAICALAKGCKDEPILLLEADTYQSIMSLFFFEAVGNQAPRSAKVECAALNLLAQLCHGSPKGRQAVTSASGFVKCFNRAVDLALFCYTRSNESDGGSKGSVVNYDDSGSSFQIQHKPVEDCNMSDLVEAALSFLLSTLPTTDIQVSLACNSMFIQLCFDYARRGTTQVIRNMAVRIVAILASSTSTENQVTPENASELLCETLTGGSVPTEELDTAERNNLASVAAHGLKCIFSKLSKEQKHATIAIVAQSYLDVLRNRSLSKAVKQTYERSSAGKLAYSLTDIMLFAMGSDELESSFFSSAIWALVGTVQWRYDGKTTIEDDELIFWNASTAHALQILAMWLEQGKPLSADGSRLSKPRSLKESVWMVARPGKAPRKAADFATAVAVAAKSGESSSRLAAERINRWLSEVG